MKLILPSFFVIVGLGFVFLNLEERFWDAFHYYRGVRKAGSTDPAAQKLVGVKAIKKDAIWLSKGGLRTVLQIEPVNYSLLEESQRKALVLSFREFLNHLTTSIQIVVKTSKPDLGDYFAKAQERLVGQSAEMNALFEDFMIFEQGFLEENNVRERKFYVVACSEDRGLIGKATNGGQELKQLEEKTKIIQEKLFACGLKSRRLENDGLVDFLSQFSSQEADSSEEDKE